MKVLEDLGFGGSKSRVFHCVDSGGSHVALRRISTRRSGSETFNEEFGERRMKELQKLKKLSCPGLLSIDSVVLDKNKREICVYSPLAMGGNLEDAQLRAGGDVGEETLVGVAFSVVSTLCYLHGRDPVPLTHGVSFPVLSIFYFPLAAF